MARLRYPTGVRPLLIDETARRRRVEASVVSILERERFAEVVLPIIDYAEPYSAAADIDPRQTYRFVDRDGDLVAIRSDFTPMVARALAPEITAEALPLRVFYRGDVIRYEASRLGQSRELFQIGAEIVGDASVDAEIAVLSLLSAVLGEVAGEPRIVYGDATIAAEPRFVPVGLADIDRHVATRLEAIEAARIPGCTLHLDDVDQDPGYYTGLRFRAYDPAARGVVVAQGGRYDSLYGRFGNPAPAVGFTLTINEPR